MSKEKTKKTLVTKDQYVTKVAEKLGATKKAAREALDAVWEVADEILSVADQKFVVEGFGTFSVEKVPAHTRVFNLTGEKIEVAEKLRRKVKFSV